MMVVRRSECPRSYWIVRMSYPDSRRCVAKMMAKGVAACPLGRAGLEDGQADGTLGNRLVEMMASSPSRHRVPV